MQILQFCSGDRNIVHGATRLSAPCYHALPWLCLRTWRPGSLAVSYRFTEMYAAQLTSRCHNTQSRNVDRTVTILSQIGTVALHSAVGRWLITKEAQVRSYRSPYDIYCGNSGTGKGVSPNTYAYSANLHSSGNAYSYIVRTMESLPRAKRDMTR